MSNYGVLEGKAQAAAVAALQESLVEFVRISLDAKQLHWNVGGREFKPLHEQLDSLADSSRSWYDDVAERIVAVGGAADGSAPAVAGVDLPAVPAGPVPASEAIAHVVRVLAQVGAQVRGRLEPLGESDLVSQDLLIGILAEVEKHLWMFRVQL